jgi:ferredoxin--NADP+ reductase
MILAGLRRFAGLCDRVTQVPTHAGPIMLTADILSTEKIEELRKEMYNATVVGVVECHDDLRVIRIRPDWGAVRFQPGQYTVLGLGSWEPRIQRAVHDDVDVAQQNKLLKRAYSFSSPMLDLNGNFVSHDSNEFVEFYVVLVRGDDEHQPSLTPRLFALDPEDRLFMGRKATGHYSLSGIQPDDNVVFVSTGTGEAPHNGMVAELLHRQHQGRVVAVTCVRRRHDLGYLECYRQIESQHPSFQYLPITTREPENLDPNHDLFVGKRYVQEYFESGEFERTSGWMLDPTCTQMFLCGNPAMIGAPRPGMSGSDKYPKPLGMVEVLESMGFQVDQRGERGNIHFEKYW